MLKIISPSKTLIKFFLALKLNLSEPQKAHTLNVMETLIMCESRKTISNLNRLICNGTDQSAMSDFFTYSPWNNESIRYNIIAYLLRCAIEQNQNQMFPPPIFISIDDSLAKKPKESKHFEGVEWHFDANAQRHLGHGLSFLMCHLTIGDYSIPIDLRIYLKADTVRRLNKKYSGKRRLSFKTKTALAQEVLQELIPFLPKGYKIYILFDSWYAGKELIKFCRRQGWHVICAIKSNRRFNGRKLSRTARHIRHKRFTRIGVNSQDSVAYYWVCVKKGRINGLDEDVQVFISKRHYRDRSPEYFLSTDTALSAKQVLTYYTNRWAVEVDHLYLKTRLGLEDFRLRSYEGIAKFSQLVLLTLQYLHWRMYEERDFHLKRITDVLALHRSQQWEATLIQFGEEVLKRQSVDILLGDFLAKAA